jgi:Flp pilus assembly pilin Flp
MHIKNKRGQSTVEYILLVTAVIAVMIVFATSSGGPLQSQLNQTLNTVVVDMGTGASVLSASHQPSNVAAPAFSENLYTVGVTP